MSLFYGVLLITCGVFLTVFTLLASRRPDPPFWVRGQWIDMAIVPTIIGLVVIGGGVLANLLANPQAQDVGPLPLALSAATVAAGALLWMRLQISKTLADYEAARAKPVLTVVDGGPLPGQPPTRRRAA